MSVSLPKVQKLDSSLLYFTDSRKAAVEAASREAAEFKANCHDILAWVNSAADRLSNAEPISSDLDTLRQQARENRVSPPHFPSLKFKKFFFKFAIWSVMVKNKLPGC